MEEKELVLKRAGNAVIARDFALAARLYKSLLAREPENPELLALLGGLYVKSGDDAKALPYFEKILAAAPDNFQALNSTGGIYRRLKEYDKATEVLQKALATGANDAEANYNLGFTYKSMGRNDDAIECFESVIDANPNDVLAYNHLASIYALKEEYAKSVSVYKRGLQIDPNHPILHFNLARSYVALGDDRNAAQEFEAALRARPGWADAVRDYSEILMRHGKSRAAGEIAGNAAATYPKDVALKVLQGKIFLNQSDFQSAEDVLEKAEALDGANPEVLSGLADVYERSGRPEMAVETLKRAEQADGGNSPALQKRVASALLSTADYEAARVRIEKLREADRNDVQAIDLNGQYYICVDDEQNADRCYQEIRRADPAYTAHLSNAARRYRQKGKLEKAEQKISAYLDVQKNDVSALLCLAELSEAMGKEDAAREIYEDVLRLDDSNVLAKRSAVRLHGAAAAKARTDVTAGGNAAAPEEPPESDSEQPPAASAAESDEAFDFDAFGELSAESERGGETDEDEEYAEDEDDAEEGNPAPDEAATDGLPPDEEAADGLPPDGDSASDEENAVLSDLEPLSDEDDEFSLDDIDGAAESDTAAREEEEPDTEDAEEDEPAPDEAAADGLPPDGDSASDEENAVLSDLEPLSDADSFAGELFPGEPEAEEPSPAPEIPAEETAESAGEADPLAGIDGIDSEEDDLPELALKSRLPSAPPSDFSEKTLSAASAALSAAAAARLESVASAAERYARQAADAAEKASAAARDAADSAQNAAQSADDAEDYIHDLTEEAEKKIIETAEKERTLLENEAVSVQDGGETAEEQTAGGLSAASGRQESGGAFPTVAEELSLFRALRELGEWLPPGQKEEFLRSRPRLLLEDLIARLSGRAGLMAAASAVRAPDGQDTPCAEAGDLPDGAALAAKVLGDLKDLSGFLPDRGLADAASAATDAVLDRI